MASGAKLLKQDDLIKSQLVLTAWRFSQKYGMGHVGAQLIMCALANRVRAGWGTWLQVIEGIPEYMADGEVPPLKYPGIWEGGFVKLLNAVDGIFDGAADDMAKGALYWGDTRFIERGWFKERIVDEKDNHPKVADFNSLTFWR